MLQISNHAHEWDAKGNNNPDSSDLKPPSHKKRVKENIPLIEWKNQEKQIPARHKNALIILFPNKFN